MFAEKAERIEDGAHLLGDGAERAADHLELDVHARQDQVSRRATIPSPHPPGGTQQVAPASSTSAGPGDARAARRPGADSGPGRDVRGAHGDELDLALAVGVAVPLLVRAVERSASRRPSGTVSSNDWPR